MQYVRGQVLHKKDLTKLQNLVTESVSEDDYRVKGSLSVINSWSSSRRIAFRFRKRELFPRTYRYQMQGRKSLTGEVVEFIHKSIAHWNISKSWLSKELERAISSLVEPVWEQDSKWPQETNSNL